MSKNSMSRMGMPKDVADGISQLGKNLRLARKIRGRTVTDVSSAAFISRETLRKLESGHAGVSLAVLGNVLWALGMADSLAKLGALSCDDEALDILDEVASRKRKIFIRHSKDDMNEYNF